MFKQTNYIFDIMTELITKILDGSFLALNTALGPYFLWEELMYPIMEKKKKKATISEFV